MKRNLDRQFVHVQCYQLHLIGAVLAVPKHQIDRLLKAGFVRLSATANPPYVSTSGSGNPVDPTPYTDDMLIKTPGSFIERIPGYWQE